jgi:hypothetical protein
MLNSSLLILKKVKIIKLPFAQLVKSALAASELTFLFNINKQMK